MSAPCSIVVPLLGAADADDGADADREGCMFECVYVSFFFAKSMIQLSHFRAAFNLIYNVCFIFVI